jgi:flagellar FliL protein
MSDKDATPPKKKGGRGKKMALLAGGAILLGGGGAAAAIYGGGLGGATAKAAEPDRPKLVPREGVSESEAARYFSPTGDKRPDPSKFKPTYYPLKDAFTANLQGDGFVQLGLGVSTYYDERVVEAVQLHEMAVRSAVLLTLAEQDALAIATPQGKEALKTALRDAVNDVLKKKEGFGGIDDVHFTSFVIQ